MANRSKDNFRISVSCHSIIEVVWCCAEEMSLFCRDFACCRDLLETYISYCPKTFGYRGLSGRVKEWENDDAELVETGVMLSDEHDISNIIA